MAATAVKVIFCLVSHNQEIGYTGILISLPKGSAYRRGGKVYGNFVEMEVD
jgi:hypothetical protein